MMDVIFHSYKEFLAYKKAKPYKFGKHEKPKRYPVACKEMIAPDETSYWEFWYLEDLAQVMGEMVKK